jgi:amino acid adenylation domain-containing protein
VTSVEATNVAGAGSTVASSAPDDDITSAGEQSVWLAARSAQGVDPYVTSTTYRVDPPVPVEAVTRAVADVIVRHPRLSVAYRYCDGRLRTRPTGNLDVRLRRYEADGTGDVVRALVATEVRRGVDLEQGPVARFVALDRSGRVDHLVLVVHHLVYDRVSMELLRRDLEESLEAALAGRSCSWRTVPAPYVDFVREQEAALDGDRGAAHLAFWEEHLRGAKDVQFPLESRVDEDFRTSSSTVTATIDRSPVKKARSAVPGILPFAPYLAAAHMTAALFAGSPELLVGLPVSRRGPKFADTLGYFVNMLSIRLHHEPEWCVADLLRNVTRVAVDAAVHAEVAMPSVRLHLAERGWKTHTPRMTFDYVGPMSALPSADERRTRRVALEPVSTRLSWASRFDLDIRVHEEPDRPSAELWIGFRNSVMEPEGGDVLVSTFRRVLAAFAEPNRLLRDIGLVDRAPLDSSVRRATGATDARSNRTRTATSSCLPTSGRLEERKNSPAVIERGDVTTYEGLAARVRRLAAALVARGVEEGDIVAVATGRRTSLLVAELAVHEAGSTFVPLDPAYPRRRLETVLHDVGASLVLVDGDDRLELSETDIPTVSVQELEAADAARSFSPRSPRPDGLAYVVYTSGSTGKPKGVEVERRSLQNLLDWFCSTYGLTAADRGLVFTSPGFDVSIFESWPFLAVGASLVIAPDEVRLDPLALRRFICEQAVTVAVLPTLLAERLMCLDWPTLTPLRYLLTGGETLRKHPPARLPFRVVNHYGPTEATVFTTAGEVPSVDVPYLLPSIGRPIPGSAILVCDPNGRVVPSGVVGEARIVGRVVGRGYRGDPGSERFTTVRVGELDAPVYVTGDLVRARPDGTLDFFGRQDRQVKVRGFRIELGEVESQLLALEGVTDATVTVVQQGARPVLAAAVATRSSTEAALRARLQEVLPAHMVPSRILVCDSLPRTLHGKVDVQAVVAMLGTPSHHDGSADDAPRSLLVDVLHAWQIVFQGAQVADDTDFYESGGDSLAAMTLVAVLEERTGVEVPVSLVLAHATPRALAEALQRLIEGSS